jgi:hypothetical protein
MRRKGGGQRCSDWLRDYVNVVRHSPESDVENGRNNVRTPVSLSIVCLKANLVAPESAFLIGISLLATTPMSLFMDDHHQQYKSYFFCGTIPFHFHPSHQVV